MNDYVPKMIFFTKGVGTHKEELHSFELALRDAGIEKCNLVQVSSIFPPACKVISKERGLKELKPGAITYCVLSRCCSNEPLAIQPGLSRICPSSSSAIVCTLGSTTVHWNLFPLPRVGVVSSLHTTRWLRSLTAISSG